MLRLLLVAATVALPVALPAAASAAPAPLGPEYVVHSRTVCCTWWATVRRKVHAPGRLRYEVATRNRPPISAIESVRCEEARPLERVVRSKRRRIARTMRLPDGFDPTAPCTVTVIGLFTTGRKPQGEWMGRRSIRVTLHARSRTPFLRGWPLIGLFDERPYSAGWQPDTPRARAGSEVSLEPRTARDHFAGRPKIRLTPQWQRCDAGLSSCTDLPGATRWRYETTDADVGSRLRAVVTATNADGSATGTTVATQPVEPRPGGASR